MKQPGQKNTTYEEEETKHVLKNMNGHTACAFWRVMLPRQAEDDGHAQSEAYLEQHFGPPRLANQPLVTYLSQLNKTTDGAGQQVGGRPRVMAITGFLFHAGLLRLRGARARENTSAPQCASILRLSPEVWIACRVTPGVVPDRSCANVYALPLGNGSYVRSLHCIGTYWHRSCHGSPC